MKLTTQSAIVTAMLAVFGGAAQAGNLTIESWRIDDKALWEEVLIPAFKKTHPSINVKFSPTTPTEYNSALHAR